ncbi:hypothetical protein [Streptomyces sp. NPDC059224]|uniref:hypothetical protein n=1 Tax=Streptomyces sp. NPDC059224 TaxID=3346775 RepID=UPI0036AAB462
MTVGTSLTPEFWEHFSVFLVLALAITAILSAVFTTVFDALNARLRNRRRHGPAPREPHRPAPSEHRTSVQC